MLTFHPRVQPEVSALGMKPSRREPMKNKSQAPKVIYVIASACNTIFCILHSPDSGQTGMTAMPREVQQLGTRASARVHAPLAHAAKGMWLLVGASWLEQALPVLQLWAGISSQSLSILRAAIPIVS